VSDKKNKWADCLAGRERQYRDVDLAGMFNHDGTPVPRARVYILTKHEEIEAVKAAHAEAAREATGAEDGAAACKDDPEFTTDMKTVQALWRAFRDIDDPTQDAFASPRWMQEKFTAHQIGYLLNTYNQCKLDVSGLGLKLDAEQLAAYRDGCVAVFDSTLPEQLLAPLPREHVTTLALMLAKGWHDEREALIARVEQLEAKQASAAGQ
jgi:hypothetical protein